MAFPVYSTRVMSGGATSGTIVDSYEVPTGKVFVVRCVTFSDGTGGAGGSLVGLRLTGDTFVVIATVTGPPAYIASELSIVVNAGELLEIYRGSGIPFWTVSGFLLDAV